MSCYRPCIIFTFSSSRNFHQQISTFSFVSLKAPHSLRMQIGCESNSPKIFILETRATEINTYKTITALRRRAHRSVSYSGIRRSCGLCFLSLRSANLTLNYSTGPEPSEHNATVIQRVGVMPSADTALLSADLHYINSSYTMTNTFTKSR